jgi:MOSC domain-containing protein YiiM
MSGALREEPAIPEAGAPAPEAPGRIEAIWLKRAHRGPMDPVTEATVVAGQGLAGNVDRSRRRQITLLAREAWTRCMMELDDDADPAGRRANILVSGLDLAHTRGRVLVVGDVQLVVCGELTPCERMDDVVPGLRAVMRPDWRGGIFAQALAGGVIRVGDLVWWNSAGDSD